MPVRLINSRRKKEKKKKRELRVSCWTKRDKSFK
jgi:hypothetical protein